jgi:predicted ferric reductase
LKTVGFPLRCLCYIFGGCVQPCSRKGYAMADAGNPRCRDIHLVAVYWSAAVLPALILLLSGHMAGGVFLAAARFFAVTGYSMLALQPVLSARFKWIEASPGLDRVLAFHRATGVTAGVFAVLHPSMLAFHYGSTSLLTGPLSSWYMTAGRVTLLILLLYGVSAVFRAALRIPFQKWLRMHNALAPVILAGGFLHSWFMLAQKEMPLSLRLFWVVVTSAALFSYIHLTIYQRLSARRKPYTVSAVNRMTANVWEIVMDPPRGKERLSFLPGQFLFITFMRGRGLPREEHPFTISSSPSEKDHISVAIKESGDFTATIGKTHPGDKAAIQAPYGRFSHLLHPRERKLVFIAGGIGVTPFLSMLRFMRDTGSRTNVALFYANRTEDDIAFRTELEAMTEGEAEPSLELIHILSSPSDDWAGERGRVSARLLERHLSTLEEAAFYVCGPPPMMDSVVTELLLAGVSSRCIHMEKFAL